MAKQKAAAPKRTESKRPSANPAMPDEMINEMERSLMGMISELENYAAHLRALDRKRLNRVGIKREGFIQSAFQFAEVSPLFLPNYLTLAQFGENARRLQRFRSLCECCDQAKEILWNITVRTADAAHTNALGFYSSVCEAAKRRVDTAETIHKDLETFFRKNKTAKGEPTEKEIKRHENALLHGKRSGKIVVENVKPKVSGGKHIVIDEQYDGEAVFRETESGAESR